jgi:hypothetical protein
LRKYDDHRRGKATSRFLTKGLKTSKSKSKSNEIEMRDEMLTDFEIERDGWGVDKDASYFPSGARTLTEASAAHRFGVV